MIWGVALAAGSLTAAGVYLALSRDGLRAVVGVSLVGAGANLVVLSAGHLVRLLPAFVDSGATRVAEDAANPLPQALVLTAIVIGFALTCFALALILSINQRFGTTTSTDLCAAEPPADDEGYPPPLDDGE